MKLYTFFQSGSAYRVRLALSLKQIAYEPIYVRGGRFASELGDPRFLALNPSGAVPVLLDGDKVLTQSLAIIEYLEERFPDRPLLPKDALGRQRVRALAQIVASDTHPLITARVLNSLRDDWGFTPEQESKWVLSWISRGLMAFETMLASSSDTGTFCHGDAASLADVFLVPQVWTALRYGYDLNKTPRIKHIYEHCLSLQAVHEAAPEQQPDAVR